MDTVTYLFHQITPVKLQQNLIKFDVDRLITCFLVEKCSPAINGMRGSVKTNQHLTSLTVLKKTLRRKYFTLRNEVTHHHEIFRVLHHWNKLEFCVSCSKCFLYPHTHTHTHTQIHTYTHHLFIHSVVCLTTDQKPLPKRALHIVRSRASSFK